MVVKGRISEKILPFVRFLFDISFCPVFLNSYLTRQFRKGTDSDKGPKKINWTLCRVTKASKK